MAFRRTWRMVARATAVTLLIDAVAVGTTVAAQGDLAAAGKVLFKQTFTTTLWTARPDRLPLPKAAAASGDTACLTAGATPPPTAGHLPDRHRCAR